MKSPPCLRCRAGRGGCRRGYVGGGSGDVPREASPPVPLSLTGEGGRSTAGIADRSVRIQQDPFAYVPPRPSGRGGQGVRLRRAERRLHLTLLDPHLSL